MSATIRYFAGGSYLGLDITDIRGISDMTLDQSMHAVIRGPTLNPRARRTPRHARASHSDSSCCPSQVVCDVSSPPRALGVGDVERVGLDHNSFNASYVSPISHASNYSSQMKPI